MIAPRPWAFKFGKSGTGWFRTLVASMRIWKLRFSANLIVLLAFYPGASADTIPSAVSVLEKYLELEPTGANAEAAKQLIVTAKASAPSAGKK